MHARILKWQTASKDRLTAMAQFEAVRAESLRIEEERQRTDRIEQLLQKVPSYYRHRTLDDFKVDCQEQYAVKRVVERYALTFSERLKEGAGLLFLGKHGTGKTMLSLILYQMLAKIGVTVSYESSLRFLRLLQEKNFESYAAFKNSLDYYQNISFLIIDEVTEGFAGKEGNLSGWERQMLFTLIDTRYQASLCTLVISNRTKQEIITRLGESVIDRLVQKNVTLAFNWRSYRQGEK